MPNIQNAQALTDVFGEWPSFHDAEVLSVLLTRHFGSGASLRTEIILWRMTHNVNEMNQYINENYTRAVLEFEDINLEYLEDFNHQNCLSDLSITEIDPPAEGSKRWRYQVLFAGIFGLRASFQCNSIRVVSAEPSGPPH